MNLIVQIPYLSETLLIFASVFGLYSFWVYTYTMYQIMRAKSISNMMNGVLMNFLNAIAASLLSGLCILFAILF